MKNVNATLFKFSGIIGALTFGLIAMFLGSKVIGLEQELWSPDSWSGKTQFLFVVSTIFALLGMFIGWIVGSRIEIRNETNHHIIGVLFNYLVIGFVSWGFIMAGYFVVVFGKENSKDFVVTYGAKLFALELMGIGAVGSFLVGLLLLITRRVKVGTIPSFVGCVVTTIPVAAIMAYIQFRLLNIGGYVWIAIALIFLVTVIPVSNAQIRRDRLRRIERET